MRYAFLTSAFCLAFMSMAPYASERPAVVAGQGFRIPAGQGSAIAPFVISFDWPKPQPKITRAVIIIHGIRRDVHGYYRTLLEAGRIAGAAGETAFIAPQFLDEDDVNARAVTRELLRWRHTDWEAGAPATGPAPLSSFEVVDALLMRLADRSLFPNLKIVVLAGHSGGGQFVQRYAVVSRAASGLSRLGIHLRFVVANPSSYVYFDDQRPAADGTLVAFQSGACPGFNSWKYGTTNAPAYVKLDADNTWSLMEADYAQRDVIYLLGTADTEPHEKDLDVSCSGEAEGRTRFARGQAYYTYLHGRHRSAWGQRMWFVSGVGHSSEKMFTSACGVSALFDVGRCPDQ